MTEDCDNKVGLAELIGSFDCEQTAVRAVRLTPDSAYCLTAGSDKSVRLWNPHRQLLLQNFVGHNQEVLDAQGSPDNGNVVSGGVDRYVYVWDVLNGRPVRHFRSHMGPVQCVAYNHDGTILASGSLDCRVHLYDLRAHGRDPLQTLSEAKDSVHAVIMNDRQIITGSLDGRLRTYDLRVGQMTDDFVGAGVLSLVESQDKQCVLVSCMDACVRLVDKQNGQILSE
jgi:mitogen-activated protein kinase organizer 1